MIHSCRAYGLTGGAVPPILGHPSESQHLLRLGGSLPTLQSFGHTGYTDRNRDRVINAFAAEFGLPLTEGDADYLQLVLKDLNEESRPTFDLSDSTPMTAAC